MRIRDGRWWVGLALLLLATMPAMAAGPGLAGATIMIIRHGEKPPHGVDLAKQGQQRAQAYAMYFSRQPPDARPRRLLASRDSHHSHRETETLAPTARALGLVEDSRFPEGAEQALVADLRRHDDGQSILICWHHGAMPTLLAALGADPGQLLPDGHWPGAVFDWMIVLHYDADGRLIPARSERKVVALLPGDR
ncbi:histidine phosphatase family protein [Frateuria aurantia]